MQLRLQDLTERKDFAGCQQLDLDCIFHLSPVLLGALKGNELPAGW
jgi:hypothetical protein